MEFSKYDTYRINDIIYYIYAVSEIDDMWSKTIDMVKDVIPYDGVSFLDGYEKGDTVTSVFYYRKEDNDVSGINTIEETISGDHYRKWILDHPRNTVIMMNEFFPEDYAESIQKNQKITEAIGFNDQLIMAFLNGGKKRAVILHRKREKGGFTEREQYILKLLYVHFESRLRRTGNNRLNGNDMRDSVFNGNILKLCSEYGLSVREKDVLIRMADNMQTNEICEDLAITISTLRKHIDKIYRKLNVSGRIELNKLLIKNNCIDRK